MFRYIALALLALLAVASAEWPNNTTTIELTFDKIMIVVLENQPLKASMKNPMMREIIKRGTLLTDYHAMVNPSQPNYIGLVGGDLLGVSNDANYDLSETNLVDLMEAKNVSWKAYQENYPKNCFAYDTVDGLYKRKHNPFMSFDNIRNNPTRCAKIVHSDELPVDLAAGTVPQYSFYTPNMNNNGHDTGLDYTANWLYSTFLPTYQESFSNSGKSLLVITFDEGVPGDNRIYTLLIGSMIPEGYTDNTRYTHYSLLKLVEDNWGLGNLGRKDAKAPQITTRYWMEGGPSYMYEGGEVTIALIVILPVGALLGVGLVAYALYVYRKRRATKVRSHTEFALLDEGDV